MSCYLCDPENPAAEEEACVECDREFWRNPVFIYVEESTDDERTEGQP